MRYRIQVTVGSGQVAAILEAALKNNPEPDLKVDQVQDDEHPMVAASRKGVIPKARMRVLPGDVVGIERPIVEKPKRKRQTPMANGGRQGVLERALQTGPKRWGELRTALADNGLSESSLNNLISQWQKAGKVRRSPEGLWSLVEQHAQEAQTA